MTASDPKIKQEVIEHVKKLLSSGEIDGFLALREQGGQVGPFFFTDPAQLEELSLGDGEKPGQARYPLVKLISKVQRANPGATIAVLLRGCDERALKRLIGDDRVHPINPAHVRAVGIACPQELAEAHQCAKPWPDALVAGQPAEGVAPPEPPADVVAELRRWSEIGQRCMKCFGCRNVCPVCSCLECTVDTEAMIPQRELPPDPQFLITRAMHMVDRCVYCGQCEEACPADLPLRDLYRAVAQVSGRGGMLPAARKTGTGG